MRFVQANGQIGPFGNGWAGETAYAACWQKHWPVALKGFHWIRATRAETAAFSNERIGQ